jgi:hypothetical protein
MLMPASDQNRVGHRRAHELPFEHQLVASGITAKLRWRRHQGQLQFMEGFGLCLASEAVELLAVEVKDLAQLYLHRISRKVALRTAPIRLSRILPLRRWLRNSHLFSIPCDDRITMRHVQVA